MVTLETATLWVHIAAGVVALLAGLVALLTAKGGWHHRRAGNVYVISMGVVVGTVVPLFAFDPFDSARQFLLLVAVFSGYLVFSGYRVLSRKRAPSDGGRADWIAGTAVILACLGLGGMGLTQLQGGNTFGIVMGVFGVIGVYLGGADLRSFRTGERSPWVVDHLTRMIAAYIATVTAVSAVNLTMVPAVIAWLFPTAAGIPLIVFWQRKYGPT